MSLLSYIVRYDSGFAPNPFKGVCTLATCKPAIRQTSKNGDWIVGCGSAAKKINRGGYLVYAMKVTKTCSFDEYWRDATFSDKKPDFRSNRENSCGDNIYHREGGGWVQEDSFHSQPDGKPQEDHIARDTAVDRVLASDDFVYFGGRGPKIPPGLDEISKVVRLHRRFEDAALIAEFERWINTLRENGGGYLGPPSDWKDLL